MEKKWIYNPHTHRWYLISSDDENYRYGISQEEIRKLGRFQAMQKYLNLKATLF